MNHLTLVQEAALHLIKQDLRYIYTVMKRIDPEKSNYIPSMVPYLGVVIDGAEDWIKCYNNSSKSKLDFPLFAEAERKYYEKARDSIKMWQKGYAPAYDRLKDAYQKSDEYFGSMCKPVAKALRLYDIYGVDTINGVMCGNTILCSCYSPDFSYNGKNGEYVKAMSIIGGKYIRLINAMEEFQVDTEAIFDTRDFGGFKKSLVGNAFSDKFVLLSILCQINFLIYGVDRWIIDEIPAKLRFGYLLFYSLTNVIEPINANLGIHLEINQNMKSDLFRNAMAHYKLRVVMNENELVLDDVMFGMTRKILKKEYGEVKKEIYGTLERLANQIGEYLKLPTDMVCNGFNCI